MQKGKFIVIEGVEGSGKSTLVAQAKSIFDRQQLLTTREPGGSDFGEAVRELMFKHPLSSATTPDTQFGLVWAARADHLAKLIKPTLETGISVLCDRFDASTYAYQIWASGATHLEQLFWEMRTAYLIHQPPDHYLFLDAQPTVTLARIKNRSTGKNFFDERELAFHERVYEGYQRFFARVPVTLIDATKPQVEVEEEFMRILNEILKLDTA